MKQIILKRKDKEGNIIEIPYTLVKDLIIQFREEHPDWPMLSSLHRMENGIVVFSTTIKNDKGIEVSNGWAMEDIKNGWINKHSVLENCETSSIGRALKHLGIGDGNPTQEEMNKQVNVDMKQNLLKSLETSLFDPEQQAHYESRINECTLEGFDELVELVMNNQKDPIDCGTGHNQGDIQKKLDIIDQNPKK